MKILSAVLLSTVAMAFVWVRSCRVTAQCSVHHTSGDELVAGDHGLLLMSNATQVVREQKRVWNATSVIIQEPAGEQALRHGPRVEHSHVTTLSSNDGVVFQDKQFETGQLISKNRTPMFVIRGTFIKKKPHSIYHRRGNISTVVDENLINESDTSQVLNKINNRLNHRQLKNNGYPTIQIDETVEDTDIFNNNQNSYDLTYDVNEKDLEENKNSIDRSGWTRFLNRSGQIIPGGLWLFETPEISGSTDQPPFRLGAHHQNKKDAEYMFKQYNANKNPKIPEKQLLKHIPPTYKIDFKTHPIPDSRQDSSILQPPEGIPAAAPNNILSSSQPNKVPITYKLLWRRLGLMALIKLGLVKLKVIGFIKLLYLLLFKLKFVLVVLFLKFFSILKFIKFSSLPLFFLPFAAIIFLVTLKTFPAYSSLILNMNNPSTLTSNTPIPNNDNVMNPLDGTIQLIEQIISTPVETILVPSGQTQTVVVPPSQTQPVTVPPVQTQPVVVPPVQTQVIAGSNIPPDVIDAFNNIGLRYDPLEVMDPTLDLFQKELNSENCVERIACKIAANGKTGIIPLWINWALHRVSKPIPNDKLLYYLKAYDDVINEIHMKSPNPDNWETWCFERYDCNNADTQ